MSEGKGVEPPRWLVFAVLVQTVQMFMSYDGGATPACIDKIETSSGISWTQAELGLLGSLDKLGMTFSSVLWGRVLQLVPAKILLVLGLGCNAASTLVFGTSGAKVPMFVAKFLMGVTQGLQCVWATCWVLTNAPMSVRTVWLGLGAISAGLGNGIGTAVAGFGTSQGLPYAVAWEVEATVLFGLWTLLVVCPSASLAIDHRDSEVERMATKGMGPEVTSTLSVYSTAPFLVGSSPTGRSSIAGDRGGCRHRLSSESTEDGYLPAINRYKSWGTSFDEAAEEMQRIRELAEDLSDQEETPQPTIKSNRRVNVLKTAEAFSEIQFRRVRTATTNVRMEAVVVVQKDVLPQLLALARNRMYVLTALLLSSVMFVTSGAQFLWVRVFVEAWGIGKSFAVVGFLLCTGLGGVVGIAFGPMAIDRCGGFLDNDGRRRSLKFIAAMMTTATCGAAVGLGTLVTKWRGGELGQPAVHGGGTLLWVTWSALFILFAGFNAALAGLTGLNIGAVPLPMRSLASGCTVSVQNLLGYALGPLLPGAVMDVTATQLGWDPADPRINAKLLCVGFGAVLLLTPSGLGCALSAIAEVKRKRDPLLKA